MPTSRFELQLNPVILRKDLQASIAGVNSDLAKLQAPTAPGTAANQQRRAIPVPRGLESRVAGGLGGKEAAQARRLAKTSQGLDKVIKDHALQAAALANTTRINLGRNITAEGGTVRAISASGQQGLARTLGYKDAKSLPPSVKDQYVKEVNKQFQTFAQATPLKDIDQAAKGWVRTLNATVLPAGTRASSTLVADTRIKAKPTHTEAANAAMAAVAESALALAKAFDLNITAVAASTEAEAILLAAIQARSKALATQAKTATTATGQPKEKRPKTPPPAPPVATFDPNQKALPPGPSARVVAAEAKLASQAREAELTQLRSRTMGTTPLDMRTVNRVGGAIPMPSVETAASKAAASADELQAKESIRVAAAAARASAALAKLGYAAPQRALPPVRGDVQPTGGLSDRGVRQAAILRAKQASEDAQRSAALLAEPRVSGRVYAHPDAVSADVAANMRNAARASGQYTQGVQGFKDKEGLTEGLIGKRISSANKAIAADEATAQISSLVQKALVGEITATELLTQAAGLLASTMTSNAAVQSAARAAVVADPKASRMVASASAQDRVSRAVAETQANAALTANPAAYQSLLQSKLRNQQFTEEESAALAQLIAQDKALIQARVNAKTAANNVATAENRAAAQSPSALASRGARRASVAELDYATAKTPEGRAAEGLKARTRQINQRSAELGMAPGEGASRWSRFSHSVGYNRGRPDEGVGKFLGGGALATLRYAVPSMALFGGLAGLKNLVKEAEELQVSMARLEGQFRSLYGGLDGFDKVRGEIIGIAKETGAQADEVANLRVQLTGAFGKDVEIGGLSGESLVSDQTKNAAKLAQTVKLPLKEITDGLTAASLEFGVSFQRIGDVAVNLEERSGVQSKETIAFIGDIAPVAKEAGYSVEEFSAIAAVAQQRSGLAGSTLAESFGRVIPALTQNKDKLLELAAADKALGTPEFIDAINSSDAKGIFDSIGASYQNMTKENKQLVVQLLGGRREAQKILPAIANQDLVKSYTESAKDSEGSLDKRFEDIKQTLTNLKQRFAETFKEFGVEILDSGILDMFTESINAVKLLITPLTTVAKILGSFNSILAGIPAQILLAVAASKLLGLSWRGITRKPIMDDLTGSQQIINGQRQWQPRFTGYRGGFFGGGNFAQGYQAWRPAPVPSSPSLVGPQNMPAYMRQTPGLAGSGVPLAPTGTIPKSISAGLQSSAKGLAAAALSPMGITVGIMVAAAAYSKISGQVAKDKAHLEEINKSIKETNESMDLTNVDVRENRIKDLEAKARDAQAALDGDAWKQIWNSIFGIQSEASEFLAAAALLRTPQEFQDQLAELSKKSAVTEDISKQTRPRLGESTANLREAAGYSDIFIGTGIELTGFTETDEGRLQLKGLNQTRDLKKNESDYIKAIAASADYDPTDSKDFEKLNSLIQLQSEAGTDPVGEAIATALGEGKQRSAAAKQASLDYLQKLFKDPDIKYKLEDLRIEYPMEDAQSDFETIGKAFELSVISRKEYIKRVGYNLKEQKNLLTKGEKEPDEKVRLAVVANEKAFEEGIDKDLKKKFDVNAKISAAYGTTESDLDAQKLVSLQAALDPKTGLKGDEERLEAALELGQLQGGQEVLLAQRAGNTAKVSELLTKGFDLDPKVLTEITLTKAKQDEGFKAVEANFEATKRFINNTAEDDKKRLSDLRKNLQGVTGAVTPSEDFSFIQKANQAKSDADVADATQLLSLADRAVNAAKGALESARQSGDEEAIASATDGLQNARINLAEARRVAAEKTLKAAESTGVDLSDPRAVAANNAKVIAVAERYERLAGEAVSAAATMGGSNEQGDLAVGNHNRALAELESVRAQALSDQLEADILSSSNWLDVTTAKEAEADAIRASDKRLSDLKAATAEAKREADAAQKTVDEQSGLPGVHDRGERLEAEEKKYALERAREAEAIEADVNARLKLGKENRELGLIGPVPEILRGATFDEGYSKYLRESFSKEGLGDKGKVEVQKGLEYLDARRHKKGIKDDEKDALDSVAGIYSAMLVQAGVDMETVKSYYAGRKQGPSKAFESGFESLPGLAETQAQLDADNLAKLGKLQEAQDNLFIAQHPGQAAVVAQRQAERAKDNADKFRALGKDAVESAEGQQALADELTAAQNARDKYVEKAVARLEVIANRQDISGNKMGALRTRLDIAKKKLAAAPGDDNEAQKIEVDSAEEAIRQQGIAEATSGYDYLSSVLEYQGKTVEVAQVGVAKAKYLVAQAQGRGIEEQNAAAAELNSANRALEDARANQRNAQFALFSTIIAKGDPVAQAKIDLVLAQAQFKEAKGVTAQAEAQKRLVEVQNQLRDSMNEARYSSYNLRQAELQAMEDDVGAAAVAAQLARAQLADAAAAGAGTAELNNLRAQVVTSEKAARDAMFQDRLDEYSYLYDMEKITRSQYVNYLEGLKSTLIPGTKQFKDLELQIKRLKDDISGDLQANLPTSFTLPTLYEARRFSQTPTSPSGAGTGTAIGYQDNRQMDIQVTIGQNMSEGQIVTVLSKALGVGTSGFSPRRY